MMSKVLCVASVLGVASAMYTKEAAADEITNLPGKPAEATFKMFGGYVDIGGGKSIYYWMVESQSNPAADPLAIWTNGGPGCSGLGGFMTEQGPFRLTKDGNLTMNPHAWNKVANMVFIEQPAGVGFSQAPPHMKYNDSQSANDNHQFILGFLQRYPQYKASPLYITSESYGGHYMPTLAKVITEKGDIPNFKGIFVGNPLTYMPYRNYGEFGTLAGHNLLPKPLWDKYIKAGCKDDDSSAVCQAFEDKMSEITADLDPYALDFPVCTTTQAAGRHERHIFAKKAGLKGYFPDNYTPCDSNWEITYMNRVDVQTAIHAKVGTKWSDCANIDYSQDDVNASMVPIWKQLIALGTLKLVIYSGDDDSVCATLGSQQFIWDMGLTIKKDWAAWKIAGQTGGYITRFNGFTFVTVHGAGHMVPATRPAQSLQLFTEYLNGQLTN
eukprot:TRINITY_DN3214_c0_g1_i1.p1 TRINITY_DN3214_c0_g1~~TRINITY_DN3214_c0_g1_i1.p1  ORF type:complete len:457 (+),score=155.92 TRINITY_DN3214_c0_g1_i1:54-1373(+)